MIILLIESNGTIVETKYFIGLDGGGTKTKCVITDFNLNPLYECQGGPSNFLIIGTEKVSDTILSLIIKCCEKLKISSNEIASVLIGTTGAGRLNDAEKLKNDFIHHSKTKGHIFNSFHVDSDARIALEGAFSGGTGALLIAGTGSIIFGKDNDGNIHRAGGFGKLLGDEGSGNTLGKRGLSAVAKEFDGRGSKTLLTVFLMNDFKIKDASELITEVYRNNFDLASFAPFVIEAAKLGDKIALQILNEETDELILHIKSIYNQLKEESLKLCFVGGTIANENFYSNMLKDKIKSLKNIEVVSAEHSPEIGAAIMAKSKFNSAKPSNL